MRFEEALQAMREGKTITNINTGEKFRLYEGHFEVISEEYPNGCHTNVNGYDLAGDDWEIVEDEPQS